ncbi:hypothetical protein ES708_17284 [subsurface metagenome]
MLVIMLNLGVLCMVDPVILICISWFATCGLYVVYRLGMRHLDLKAEQVRVTRQKMQAIRAAGKAPVAGGSSTAAPGAELPPWIPELLDRLGLGDESGDIPEGIERYLPIIEKLLQGRPPPPGAVPALPEQPVDRAPTEW